MRRNPLIPLSGASFVTNPRRKAKRNSAKMKRNSKGRFVRTNGLALRTNKAKRARKASPAKRLLMRLNGGSFRPSFRPSGIKPMTYSAHPGATMARLRMNRLKRNGLALRTNGLALRTNGLALRTNRKHKRRRNPDIQSKITGMVQKVPVVGKTLAAAIGPVVVGLAAGAVHLFVVGKYGHMLPAQIQPIGYTLGGIGIAALVRFVPLGSPTFRTAVGAAAITVGAALDLIRYLKEDGFAPTSTAGPYGEGGMWEMVDYSDASLADAYQCAADLGAEEAQLAQQGPGAWHRFFKGVRRATRVGGNGTSAHAGQPGHQWGWAIRLLGWPNFAKLAAMPSSARQEYITKLRQYAIAALPGGQSPADVHQSYQGAVYAGY